MNRAAAIAVLLSATAAGFAAGWFSGDTGASAAGDSARHTRAPQHSHAVTTATGAATVSPVPRFPALESVDDCRIFLTHLGRQRSSGHPYTRRAMRDFALRRWLEIDAESALAEAENQPGNEFSTEGFAPDLFRVWLDLHVDSAISAWNQANPILARNVRVAFLTTLADKDPEYAFKVWQTARGQGQEEGDPAGEEIFRRWAQRDPRGAIAKAPSGSYEQSIAISEWAQNQPREALAYVQSMQNGRLFLSDPAFLPVVLRTNPALVQTALANMGPVSREIAGKNWVERDLSGAFEWAKNQGPNVPLASEVLFAAARKLASADPERALQILKGRRQAPPQQQDQDSSAPSRGSRPGAREQALREAFAAIAASNPARIRELVASEPELAKEGGLAGYFTYAFASDPAAAITQYREWAKNPALKDAAMESVLKAFRRDQGTGARDPSALLTAVPELADMVDGTVLSGWAMANPTSAAEFILQRTSAGKPIEKLKEEGVLAQLAISQPQYTSRWLQRLRDPELQQQVANTLAANWSAFDPVGFAEWVNALPDGPVREAALAGYDRRMKGRGD